MGQMGRGGWVWHRAERQEQLCLELSWQLGLQGIPWGVLIHPLSIISLRLVVFYLFPCKKTTRARGEFWAFFAVAGSSEFSVLSGMIGNSICIGRELVRAYLWCLVNRAMVELVTSLPLLVTSSVCIVSHHSKVLKERWTYRHFSDVTVGSKGGTLILNFVALQLWT